MLFWIEFLPVTVSIFYLEQYHSDITSNEHKKALCVAITHSPALQNISTANALCTPVQAMIISLKKNGKILARCVTFHYGQTNDNT